jgi:RNA polymerase primary sigma factor
MTNVKTDLPSALLERGLQLLKDPRDAHVLKLRYGLAGETRHTLQQIGDELKITRERVRQIEKRIMRKLKHPKNKLEVK